MSKDYGNLPLRTLELKHDTALTKQFVTLGGICLRDGNMYGAVIGDLSNGCFGFEKTRNAAVMKCMHKWWNEEAEIPGKKK